MSTFDGFIHEFPFISIDRFEKHNLDSAGLFLSHCHSDHMVGLDSKLLHTTLEERNNVYIYCSEISKLWLCEGDGKYRHLEKYLVTLSIEHPEELKLCDKDGKESTVKVTLIPSGHCPGSVMFLLEDDTSCVLYTGDFRWRIGQARQVEHFKDGHSLKTFNSLYIDTTFCERNAYHIPDREECAQAIIATITPHIDRNKGHVVRLECKAQLGYEYLFSELSKRFKMKIHVSEWQWQKYKCIPELVSYVTTNPEETQIHACKPIDKQKCMSGPYLRCGYTGSDGVTVIVIQTSTMWWSMFGVNMKELCIRPEVVKKPWFYRACYSTHSSYSEIRDLVQYIRPRAVYANVIPNKSTYDDINDRLQGFLTSNHEDLMDSSPVYRPLGVVKVSSNVPASNNVGDGEFGDGQKTSALYFGSFENSTVTVSAVARSESHSEQGCSEESYVNDSQCTYMSEGEDELGGDDISEEEYGYGHDTSEVHCHSYPDNIHSLNMSNAQDHEMQDTERDLNIDGGTNPSERNEVIADDEKTSIKDDNDDAAAENCNVGNDMDTSDKGDNDVVYDESSSTGIPHHENDGVVDGQANLCDEDKSNLYVEDTRNENSCDDDDNDDDASVQSCGEDDIIFVEEKPLREVPAFALRTSRNTCLVEQKQTMQQEERESDAEEEEHSSASYSDSSESDEVECIDLTQEDEDGSNIIRESESNKRQIESPLFDNSGCAVKRGRIDAEETSTDNVVCLDDNDDDVSTGNSERLLPTQKSDNAIEIQQQPSKSSDSHAIEQHGENDDSLKDKEQHGENDNSVKDKHQQDESDKSIESDDSVKDKEQDSENDNSVKDKQQQGESNDSIKNKQQPDESDDSVKDTQQRAKSGDPLKHENCIQLEKNSKENIDSAQVILPPIFEQGSPIAGIKQSSQSSDSSIELTPSKVIPFSK